MYDLCWVPIVVAAGGELAQSAMPVAPVVAERPRRERRWLRAIAERLVAPRPRRLEREEACAT
jgi:antitoxin (DNA-binding transcriptional repressor) of toxin-antitoxin stability system